MKGRATEYLVSALAPQDATGARAAAAEIHVRAATGEIHARAATAATGSRAATAATGSRAPTAARCSRAAAAATCSRPGTAATCSRAALDEFFRTHPHHYDRGTQIRISPGGHYVTSCPDEMLVTVLGSCVSACIRDPFAGVGGMNHFMLPESEDGAWGIASASLRFGNFAMERLINDILSRGGSRRNLEIKVFGGASIIGSGAHVGARNADFVESYLRQEGLPIAAGDLRGAHARRIHYYPTSGRVRMLELPRVELSVVKLELDFADRLDTEPVAGSIELFE